MDKLTHKIKNIKGISELLKHGEVFLVGGIVRDHFLNKESKDIDLLVRLISLNDIKNILSKFGKIDEVGESFGVLKFRPDGWTDEDIDIALPRIDKKIGIGHKGIEAISDPFLSIEDDLKRRDIRINSICINLNEEKLVDPFNGMCDLENGIISATSPNSFIEDPLRMMRVIQFASRFDFKIDTETWNMILENKKLIKEISGERIYDELMKIFKKGNIQSGLELFENSGLREEIIPGIFNNINIKPNRNYIKTVEDFFFIICGNSKSFKERLKGEADIAKGIDALKTLQNKSSELRNNSTFSNAKARQMIFDCIQISKSILNSGIAENIKVIDEFKNGTMPTSIKELAVNGAELMQQGFIGVEIGKRQRLLLSEIFESKRLNIKDDLLK